MSLHENLETQWEFVRQLLLGVLRVELQVEGVAEWVLVAQQEVELLPSLQFPESVAFF